MIQIKMPLQNGIDITPQNRVYTIVYNRVTKISEMIIMPENYAILDIQLYFKITYENYADLDFTYIFSTNSFSIC